MFIVHFMPGTFKNVVLVCVGLWAHSVLDLQATFQLSEVIFLWTLSIVLILIKCYILEAGCASMFMVKENT
jgi:hypothetical protein